MTTENESLIAIYENANKVVDGRLDTGKETVWLNLQQRIPV